MNADKLWEQFMEVPTDGEGGITEGFLDFPVGTYQDNIWYWFEDTFGVGVVHNLICFGESEPSDCDVSVEAAQ